MEEVNDIDVFLKYGLEGIPTLTINGALAFQQTVPEVAELIDRLNLFDSILKLI